MKKVLLLPLEETDFDNLYEVASDKKIWEQHPCKDRWKREVFKIFFDEAILSKGAFVKKLMMDYIFQYVDKIYFYIGAYNFCSQIAVTRLGAKKIKGEENSGSENLKKNFVYEIHKNQYNNTD